MASYAQEVIEGLRAAGCDSMADGSDSFGTHYQFAWTVAAPSGTNTKRIQLIATYPGEGTVRVDTLETSVPCT